MTFGVLATEVPYRQHIQPVWDALREDERGPFVLRGDRLVRAKADIWITAANRDYQRIRRLRGRTVLMEHGCGLQWFAPHVLKSVVQADLIAAPNEFIGSRYAALGAHVEVVGTPKMDALLGIPAPHGGTVAVSFHWTSITRQGNGILAYYRSAIEKLAANHHVIGHGHPRVWPKLEAYWKRLRVEAVPDFTEVVRRADVYCCDHSSTMFEWAALDRPVVMLHNPAGMRVVPQASGLRYEHHADIGMRATPDTLNEIVGQALINDGRHYERMAARAELFPWWGCATRVALDVLHDMEA